MKRYLRLALRLLTRPRWGWETLRMWRRRRTLDEAAIPWGAFAPHLVDVETALTRVAVPAGAGAPPALTREAGHAEFAPWDASDEFARMLWALVRGVRPRQVVEVGVARGYSSAVILEALEANGEGRLTSIDMPGVAEPGTITGELVPARLRHRWELRLGPSSTLLPRVLAEVGEVDLFIHDGDHSAETQRVEFAMAWPHLRAGGVLVMDDLWSTAFLEACAAAGVEALVVRQSDAQKAGAQKAGPLGITRKP